MTFTLKSAPCAAAVCALIASGAVAQTSTDETVLPAPGGQVVVEQEDATVDVTVPEPVVTVDQAPPEVLVEQPQPEINVTVPEPNVTVQQTAPIITIEQAQPVVTVVIPEPVVTVRVPEPQVGVATADPDISVTQPEPVVRFVRPEPRITVETGEPRVTVDAAEAEVRVNRAEGADIRVDQAEANVTVDRVEGGDVDIVAASEAPQVDITQSGEADVSVEQGEAVIDVQRYNADASGALASDADREVYRETVRANPISAIRISDLLNMNVLSEGGEDVGEIDYIGVRGETVVVIVGLGGFLGLGEREIALPIDRLRVRDGVVYLPKISEAELDGMPEYDESEVVLTEGDSLISDLLDS